MKIIRQFKLLKILSTKYLSRVTLKKHTYPIQQYTYSFLDAQLVHGNKRMDLIVKLRLKFFNNVSDSLKT